MRDSPEAQLLDRYRSGDASAFAELVRRHQGALLRHAACLLGPATSVEDVVQEAFLRLAQAPPSVPPEASDDPELSRRYLTSWLHKVTRNLCMDVMRTESRRRSREEDAAVREAHGGGMGVVEENDTRAAVERSLGGLPPDQREVLMLRLIGEKSYKEIAEITGKKIGTIGWLVSVGLKTLSADLAPLLHGRDRTERGQAKPGARLGMVKGELS